MSVAALILAAQALKNRNTADTEAYKALIDQIATLADRPGRDGRDGRDGASIDRAVVRDGRLVLTRSTGDDIDVGPVTGPKGDQGEPGPKGESIVGPAGPAGRDGRDGEDGVGIADVERVKDNIVLTLDDGRTVDLGSFRGPAGPSGPRGPAGTGGTGGGGAAITVQDEGSTLTTEATSLNFTGSGVTATNSGSSVTIDVPGSSGFSYQGAMVYRATTGATSLFPDTLVSVCAFDATQHDTSSLWQSGTNRFLIPSGWTYASFAAQVALSSTATDYGWILIRRVTTPAAVIGLGYQFNQVGANYYGIVNSGPTPVVAGEEYEAVVLNRTGSNCSYLSGALNECWFKIWRVL